MSLAIRQADYWELTIFGSPSSAIGFTKHENNSFWAVIPCPQTLLAVISSSQYCELAEVLNFRLDHRCRRAQVARTCLLFSFYPTAYAAPSAITCHVMVYCPLHFLALGLLPLDLFDYWMIFSWVRGCSRV